MAKGKTCSSCNMPMYAVKEEHQENGTWVVYQCENGSCSQYKQPKKEFEAKK